MEAAANQKEYHRSFLAAYRFRVLLHCFLHGLLIAHRSLQHGEHVVEVERNIRVAAFRHELARRFNVHS